MQRLVSQHRAPCDWLRLPEADFQEQGVLPNSQAAYGQKQPDGSVSDITNCQSERRGSSSKRQWVPGLLSVVSRVTIPSSTYPMYLHTTCLRYHQLEP